MVKFKDKEAKHPILKGRKRKRVKRQCVAAKGEEKQVYWKSPNGEVVERSPEKKQTPSPSNSFRNSARRSRRKCAEEFQRSESSKATAKQAALDQDAAFTSPTRKRRKKAPADDTAMDEKADNSHDDSESQSQVLEVHTPYSDTEDAAVLQCVRRKSLFLSSRNENLESKLSKVGALENNSLGKDSGRTDSNCEIEVLRSHLVDKDAAIRLASESKQKSILNEEYILKEISAMRKALGSEPESRVQTDQESRFEEIQEGITQLGKDIKELVHSQNNRGLQDTRKDPVDSSEKEENHKERATSSPPESKPLADNSENNAKLEQAMPSSGILAIQLKGLQEHLAAEQRSNGSLRISESALHKEVVHLKSEVARLIEAEQQQTSALEASRKVEALQAEQLRALSTSIAETIAEKKVLQESLASLKSSIDARHCEHDAKVKRELAVLSAELEDRDRTCAALRIQYEDAKEVTLKLKTELASVKERENDAIVHIHELKDTSSRLAEEVKRSKEGIEKIPRVHAKNLERQLLTLAEQHAEDAERKNKELQASIDKVKELERIEEEWKLKSNRLNDEMQCLLSKIGEIQACLASREADATECKAELEQCKKQRDDLEGEIAGLQLLNIAIPRLKDNICSLKADKEALEAKLEILNVDLQGSVSKNEKLQFKLLVAEELVIKKDQQLLALQDTTKELQGRMDRIQEIKGTVEAELVKTIKDRETSAAALIELEADRSKLRASLNQVHEKLELAKKELLENRADFQKHQNQSKEEMRECQFELAKLKADLKVAVEEIQSSKEATNGSQNELELERHSSTEKERKLLEDLSKKDNIVDSCRKDLEEKYFELEQSKDLNARTLRELTSSHEVAIASLNDQLRSLKSKNKVLQSRCYGLLSSEVRFGNSQPGEAGRKQLNSNRNLKKAVDKAAIVVELSNSAMKVTEALPYQGDGKEGVGTKTPIHMKPQKEDDLPGKASPSRYGDLPKNTKPDNSAVDLNDGPTSPKITYDGKALRFRQKGKQTITIHSDSDDEDVLY